MMPDSANRLADTPPRSSRASKLICTALLFLPALAAYHLLVWEQEQRISQDWNLYHWPQLASAYQPGTPGSQLACRTDYSCGSAVVFGITPYDGGHMAVCTNASCEKLAKNLNSLIALAITLLAGWLGCAVSRRIINALK
jgi:hypothetical protein